MLIITAANQAFVPGVELLHDTLRSSGNNEPLRCYDLGIDDDSSLVDRGIEVVQIPILKTLADGSEKPGWPQLSKPRCLAHAMQEHSHVLWIDSDMAVNRSLRMVWHAISRRPFFVDQGKYGLEQHNDAKKLKKSGIVLSPWKAKRIPSSAIIGFARADNRDDLKFVEQWQRLCDDYADGWVYWDQGPFMHLVSRYKKAQFWQGETWNVMGGEIGFTRDNTIELLPERCIRHFAGPRKPWLNWDNAEKVRDIVEPSVLIEARKKQVEAQNEKARRKKNSRATIPAAISHENAVGTKMKAWAKLKPCQRCENTMNKMNLLGPDGCRDRFDELVEEVKKNATAYNMFTAAFSKIPGVKTLTGCAVSYALEKSIQEVESLIAAENVDLFSPPSWEPERVEFDKPVVVTVACGDESLELHEYSAISQRAFAERIGADYYVIQDDWFPEFPIGNKWRLAGLHAPLILYLDVDVFVKKDCPDLTVGFRDGAAWMHNDMTKLKNTDWLSPEVTKVMRSQGIVPKSYQCFNTGVVLYNKPEIWRKPAYPFPNVHCAEQHLIEQRCYQSGLSIMGLDWRFNLQPYFDEYKDLKEDGHMIHLVNMEHEKRMEFAKWFVQSQF